GREAHRLAMNLRHERAGGVDRAKATLLGAGTDARSDAVGGEYADSALGHLGLLVNEDRSPLAQPGDHVLVVDDLLADVDGRAVDLERSFDGLHGAIDSCAVPAWGRQQ